MSDYRFGVDDYGLNYYPHDGVYDEQEGIDWSKVERVEIDWVDFVRERTCECIAEYAKSPIDGKTIVLHRCSSCHELMRPYMNYCPHCGAKVLRNTPKYSEN